MATREELIAKLLMLTDTDLSMVISLAEFLTNNPANRVVAPSDEEIWWGEITGDMSARHAAAAPLWDELAGLQKEPTKHARRIAELKKRLRQLGEI